jgi:hypothetical protein
MPIGLSDDRWPSRSSIGPMNWTESENWNWNLSDRRLMSRSRCQYRYRCLSHSIDSS